MFGFIMPQVLLVASLGSAPAQTEQLRIYLSNQSRGDLIISNTLPALPGQAPLEPVVLGFYQPADPNPAQPLLAGASRTIPSGNAVFLGLSSAPTQPQATEYQLAQAGRPVAVLRYLVWLQGTEANALGELLYQDGQAWVEDLTGDIFVYFGDEN